MVAICAVSDDTWGEMTDGEAIEYLKGAPNRSRDTSAELGTHIHDEIERMILSGEPSSSYPLPIRRQMENFRAWCEEFNPEWEASELRAYSRTHGYAGTLDAIAVIDGTRYILDVKSGKGVYPSAALQLAAYAHADFTVIDKFHPGSIQVTPNRGRRYYEWSGPAQDEYPLPDIEAAGVLHIREDHCTLFPVTTDLGELFETFLTVKKVDEWCRRNSKTFGKAMVMA
jgi:hypothetical protein